MWIYFAFMFFVYCSHYVYNKDFYQVLFVAYFSGFLPVSASIFQFNFSIDCLKYINIFFLEESVAFTQNTLVGRTQIFISVNFLALEFFFPSWLSSRCFFLLRRTAITSLRLQTLAVTTLVLRNLCIAWKLYEGAKRPKCNHNFTREVLIPAIARTCPNHLETVDGDTGLCGLIWLTSNWLSSTPQTLRLSR